MALGSFQRCLSRIIWSTVGVAHHVPPLGADRVLEKVLAKQLQKAGCIVHVANHGQEALDFLQRSNLWRNNEGGEAVHIVLMDLEMPVMDGLACARRIRELQAQGTLIRHVPLIAVTANARKEQIDTSLAAGMVSYLSVFLLWKSIAHQISLSDVQPGRCYAEAF